MLPEVHTFNRDPALNAMELRASACDELGQDRAAALCKDAGKTSNLAGAGATCTEGV